MFSRMIINEESLFKHLEKEFEGKSFFFNKFEFFK